MVSYTPINYPTKNLKTTSVFLDISFRAVLGDFGFVLCGAESKKVRVSMVGGRQRLEAELGQLEERDLLDFAWRMHEKDEMARVVDRRMGTVINLEQAIRVMQIGLLCTLNVTKGRPCMEQVVEFLSMERPIPELPPSRPVALFPYNSTGALCTDCKCKSQIATCAAVLHFPHVPIGIPFTHALLGLGASLFTIAPSKAEELPAPRPEMKPIDASSSESITVIAMLIPNLGLPQGSRH
ncbi:hypothetical protein Prudu_007863 [Prunus dulcis]|uniref:Uncharacterized protein n=1 Tax=Prunus dulcis TaxID=3755 RepID=A0A4Y1R324_PRUDU|nr:hypothetical protein Prudu_007863 [Prunus dulcis]